MNKQEEKLFKSKTPEEYIDNSLKVKLTPGRKAYITRLWLEKKKQALAALERVKEEIGLTTKHVETQLRESPDVSDEILQAATELDSDLIVLGHKGKGAIKKFLLGSVTTRIAHHAPCSVLAVRK